MPSCLICKKVYKNDGISFQKHVLLHEKGELVGGCFKCGECGVLLATRSIYQHHVKSHIKDRVKYPCRVDKLCEKSFFEERYRNTHEKSCVNKCTYAPPTEFFNAQGRAVYILYNRYQHQITHCIGLYKSLKEASQHTGLSKDVLQNLYLGRASRYSKKLVMLKLPKFKLSKNDYLNIKDDLTVSMSENDI